MKSTRGRGGIVSDVLYEGITAVGVQTALDVSLRYDGYVPPTNASATPVFRGITIRDMQGSATGDAVSVQGISDSPIQIALQNVSIRSGTGRFVCTDAECSVSGVNVSSS